MYICYIISSPVTSEDEGLSEYETYCYTCYIQLTIPLHHVLLTIHNALCIICNTLLFSHCVFYGIEPYQWALTACWCQLTGGPPCRHASPPTGGRWRSPYQGTRPRRCRGGETLPSPSWRKDIRHPRQWRRHRQSQWRMRLRWRPLWKTERTFRLNLQVGRILAQGQVSKGYEWVSECWVFYAIPTARVKPVWTYSVLVENKFGLFQSWVIESMRWNAYL